MHHIMIIKTYNNIKNKELIVSFFNFFRNNYSNSVES